MFKNEYKDADTYLLQMFPILYAQAIVNRGSSFVVHESYEDFKTHTENMSDKYGVVFKPSLDGFVYALLIDTSKAIQILHDRFELWYDESGDPIETLTEIYHEITACELS